jgi:pimeloyl-ACP methyl ester carboxylesterase
VSQPPNGRVLPLSLDGLNEPALFRPGGLAAIYALGANQDDYHPERDPLLFVHGIEGEPADLQGVVDRFRGSGFQLYALAYPDFDRRTSINGDDLADELRGLVARIGTGRSVRIVAHSMGGIVCRQALNELAAGQVGGAGEFGSIELYTADTPWHGYPGPSDEGFEGFMMSMTRVFLPAGLDDMRALSAMFQGDPGSADPAAQAGLYGVDLPDHFSVDVAFAAEGDEVLDYTQDVLAELPARLVDYYREEKPVRGDARLVNFWRALISADAYWDFQERARALADEGRLDAAGALAALQEFYPRFPGDHVGILREHSGQFSFIDHLAAKLR